MEKPVRLRYLTTALLAVILVSACDFWPQDLAPLAESIKQQVSGETRALRVGGDVVLIDVANSPFYRKARPELEATATEIAEQAIALTTVPLESIVVTFHAGEISEDPEKEHEFIFLVMDGRPVLQPQFDIDATGPLSPEEVQAAVDRLGDSFSGEQKKCVSGEVEQRARAAGDPETLDPADFEFLPAETWNDLDAFGKRIILTGAITTQALFSCVRDAHD
jgi:hypothetical protein